MKYLVMECRPAYAVVLGGDGRFVKVANMHYEVGQTVTDVVVLNLPEVIEKPVKTNHRRWISSLTAIAACLALIVTSVFFTGQMPYASVYMTINPEVRVDVNRNDVVVGVEGMNTDGAELLRDYDHRKKDLDTVMDELVDLAIDMGYLHEGGKVTLTLDAQDEEWVVTHSEKLSTHLTEHLTDKISVIIDVERKATEEITQPSSIVIPVGPDSYQDSDYGEITETTTVPTETRAAPAQTTAPPATEDSGYDDGQTDYDDKSDDDGDTPYGEPSDDDEDTPCEAPSDDDGDTHYEEPSEDDDTDYEDSSDEEDTDYDD